MREISWVQRVVQSRYNQQHGNQQLPPKIPKSRLPPPPHFHSTLFKNQNSKPKSKPLNHFPLINQKHNKIRKKEKCISISYQSSSHHSFTSCRVLLPPQSHPPPKPIRLLPNNPNLIPQRPQAYKLNLELCPLDPPRHSPLPSFLPSHHASCTRASHAQIAPCTERPTQALVLGAALGPRPPPRMQLTLPHPLRLR